MLTQSTITAPVEPDDTIAQALAESLAIFDRELRSDLPPVNRLVEQIRSYRGKLLRPKLLLLTGQACGGIRRDHLVAAAVVEMIHMATLVHDDVLDEADVRRDGPSVNRMAGNEGAVLLGDYLISHAYHLCSSLGSTRVSRRVAAATNTVCEGELLQIDRRGDLDLSEADYLEIIRRKTAALTAVCCELGASLAGTDAETISRLSAFGEDLGMAFQIIDDLLDVTADTDQLGKTAGRDADLGKVTLPIIRFLQSRDRTAADAMRRALSDSCGPNAPTIHRLLVNSDALDSTMQTARSYVDRAASHLAYLPPSLAKDRLLAAAQAVVDRRR